MAEGGRSSGLTGRDDFFSQAAAQATHDNQTTSNMIKESLLNLKQRLNQMKESSAMTATFGIRVGRHSRDVKFINDQK